MDFGWFNQPSVSWTVVEFVGDGVESGLRVARQVGSFGEVPAQEHERSGYNWSLVARRRLSAGLAAAAPPGIRSAARTTRARWRCRGAGRSLTCWALRPGSQNRHRRHAGTSSLHRGR